MGENISINYTWIFIVLLLPACVCAFYLGYRSESYGWAVGMITVALWAIIMKPLFNLVLQWIMDPSHVSSPFAWRRIALDLGFGLPAGALLGWLGEKRATTGMAIRT